jgi:hypothetical protein
MGNRAVWGFRDKSDSPIVFLYSHWGGGTRHEDLALALEASRPRWSDESYATRICISSIIGDDWRGETGYGISVNSFSAPNYDNYTVVTWASKTVSFYSYNWGEGVEGSKEYDRITFDNFCEAFKPVSAPNLFLIK